MNLRQALTEAWRLKHLEKVERRLRVERAITRGLAELVLELEQHVRELEGTE